MAGPLDWRTRCLASPYRIEIVMLTRLPPLEQLAPAPGGFPHQLIGATTGYSPTAAAVLFALYAAGRLVLLFLFGKRAERASASLSSRVVRGRRRSGRVTYPDRITGLRPDRDTVASPMHSAAGRVTARDGLHGRVWDRRSIVETASPHSLDTVVNGWRRAQTRGRERVCPRSRRRGPPCLLGPSAEGCIAVRCLSEPRTDVRISARSRTTSSRHRHSRSALSYLEFVTD
jgi:hypothetical protein